MAKVASKITSTHPKTTATSWGTCNVCRILQNTKVKRTLLYISPAKNLIVNALFI